MLAAGWLIMRALAACLFRLSSLSGSHAVNEDWFIETPAVICSLRREENMLRCISPHSALSVSPFHCCLLRLIPPSHSYRLSLHVQCILAWYKILINSRVHSSVKSQFPKVRQTNARLRTCACDGGITVLNHCLSSSKFANTNLSHSRQWFNIN